MLKKFLMSSVLVTAIAYTTIMGSGYSNISFQASSRENGDILEISNISVADSGGDGIICVVPRNIEIPNVSVADSGGDGIICVVPRNIEIPNTSVADSGGDGIICVVPRTI